MELFRTFCANLKARRKDRAWPDGSYRQHLEAWASMDDPLKAPPTAPPRLIDRGGFTEAEKYRILHDQR